jgi:hypothetical protein
MSRSFKSYSGKSAFAEVQEPMDAGEYILNKKASTTYCKPNVCQPNRNIGSESNLLTLKKANALLFNSFIDNFNKSELYVNLYTQLDLDGVAVITDLSGNFPVSMTTNIPYLNKNSNLPNYTNYVIDPSGNLFGNTTCGIDNYTNYMTYVPQNNSST